MGQTTSRRRQPLPLIDPTPALARSSSHSELNPSPEFPSPSSTFRRRLPINRTLRNLLPRPRSTRDGSTTLDSPSSWRKRWRSSKRLSNRPSSMPHFSETINEDSSCTSPISLDPDTSLPRGNQFEGTNVTPVHPNVPLPSALQSPSLGSCATQVPYAEETHLEQRSLDSKGHTVVNFPQPCETPNRPDEVEEDINVMITDGIEAKENKPFVQGSSRDYNPSLPSLETTPEPSLSNTIPEPTFDPQPQVPRHFQSPGPLVVVQGVVNTSDNPAATQGSTNSHPIRTVSNSHRSLASPMSRRRSLSIPSHGSLSDDRHSTRNRLSALIPRGSILGRRASTPDPMAASSHGTSFDGHVESLADVSDDALGTQQDAFPHHEAHADSENDIRPRPLSPGSIDVLGTLLSVAAAATAASLFSPNMGFHVDRHPDPLSLPRIPRPMSPTPTAGLGSGSGEGLAGLSALGLDPPSPDVSLVHPSPTSPVFTQHREGRDRMRNVWDSFRDRLGLNRNSSGIRPGDELTTSPEGQSNLRPSEVMLAEMARALNVGLGLNHEDSADTRSGEPTTMPTHREAPRMTDDAISGSNEPPESSFERFLLNLQAALRNALSEDAEATSVPRLSTGHNTRHNGDTIANSRQALFNELPIGLVETMGDESPPSDEDDNSDDYQTSTRTPTPMPSAQFAAQGTRDRVSLDSVHAEDGVNADRVPPGINLWRLYRFQPIPATQVAGHAPAAMSSPLGQSLAPSYSTSTPIPSASQSSSPAESTLSSASPSTSSSDSGPSTQSAAPLAEDSTPGMVVPVIVVGLQSVEMGQMQGRTRPDAEAGRHDFDETDRRSLLFDNVQASNTTEESDPTTARGRSWQSRAATALRNLRPGRRNTSVGQRSGDGSGSRTFLIYVIGGYYPPNHHMVTGSENLDSYEALWELAELLGQVKPPVATREDIDNSGLQIIKSTELGYYEQQGKVASNCVERCLICLDDYSPEEDLRLMSCKHLFHRDCVDKWLQVGRNNCPACRTKGVSTAGESAN